MPDEHVWDPRISWINGHNGQEGGDVKTRPLGSYQALTSPDSTASNALYYGGNAGQSEADINRARQLGYRAQERTGPQMDPAQMAQSRGQLGGLAGGFQALAGGDPNSVNQQQLARGYGAANAQIGATANSARGGGIASALAQRTADNQIGANSQKQAVQSRDLMAQEQKNAFGNLGALGGQMRGADAQAAFGQANLSAEQRARNDAMTAEYERQQNQIAQLGMQGQMNRQGQRSNALQTYLGQSHVENDARRNQEAYSTNQALGALSSGASAAGSIWNQARQSQTPDTAPDPNKKDFAWSG